MNGRQRFVLVAACIVCLLALTVTLPAADPRLEAPGTSDDTSGGDWDTLTNEGDEESAEEPEPTPDDSDDQNEGDEDQTTEQEPTLNITGAVIPGNTVQIRVENVEAVDSTIRVDGDDVGTLLVEVVVPFENEMNVTAPDASLQKTVDIPTDGVIELENQPVQNTKTNASVEIDGRDIPRAELYQDGQLVGTTDENGRVEIQIPERVGTLDLRAKRGGLNTTRQVQLREPAARFTSPIMLPGAPAPVRVTAYGQGVPNATVSIPGGDTATTNNRGYARVSLPIDSQATAVLEMDGAESTAAANHLYIRLTVIFVLLPGLALGLVYTYLRFVAEGSDTRGTTTASARARRDLLTAIFVGLADSLSNLLDAFRDPTLPSPRMPDLSLGNFSGIGFPSLSGLVPSMPRPSTPDFGSLASGLLSGSDSGGGASRLNPFSSDENATEDESVPGLAEEPLGPPEPGTEVRTLWHRFLDRVKIDRRETQTPGQVARLALSAGFPARQVRRLLARFRQVEYGDQEASPEYVQDARRATSELLDHEPEDDGSDQPEGNA